MLRRQPENILINSLSATTVTTITGGVNIEGYGDLLEAEILECYIKCIDDCTLKVVTVVIAVPTTCECPFEWTITIKCKPDGSYETQETFPVERLYNYTDPAGGVPAVDDVGAAIAANVNADPYACVTASYDSGSNTLTFTAKDCEHNFDVFTPFITGNGIDVVTPFTPAFLTDKKLAQMFPIKPGSFGSRPALTNCGDYCIYHFKLRSTNDVQDISAANHYNGYEREVNFVVKSDLATYDAQWKDELLAAFDCLNDFS